MPWHLVLGDDVIRAHEGVLATHYHGMDFLKLDGLDGRLEDENELVEDLHLMNLKSVDLSGAILMVKMWNNRAWPSWHETLPFGQ